MPEQLEFKKVKGWGGKRRGAGRPNLSGTVGHGKREAISLKTPVHINLHLVKGLKSLRRNDVEKEFRKALIAAKPFGLAVLHYSIQDTHVHLIVEAESSKALARGMKSFGSRFGKAIRRLIGGRGSVFAGRFHDHVLKTPTEMKRSLSYVLLNFSKHERLIEHIDGFSSGWAFRDWRKLLGRRVSALLEEQLQDMWRNRRHDELTEARSWMAREGWKRAA